MSWFIVRSTVNLGELWDEAMPKISTNPASFFAGNNMSMAIRPCLVVFVLVVCAWSCSAKFLRPTPQTAKEAYDIGMSDFDDGMFPESITSFAELKAKFPYSKYAALAELRIADALFEQGKFLESIDAYRSFLRFHPTHQDVPYATFRIAESYFEQIPADWWFLPPVAEKDQANIRLSLSAYRDFLNHHPDLSQTENGSKRLSACRARLEKTSDDSAAPDEQKQACQRLLDIQSYVERAQTQFDICRRKLADHEMYVAKFYFDRERYRAAAGRATVLLKDYPGVGIEKEALWLAAQSHWELEEFDKAEQELAQLTKEHSGSDEAKEASRLLNQLKATRRKRGADNTSVRGR